MSLLIFYQIGVSTLSHYYKENIYKLTQFQSRTNSENENCSNMYLWKFKSNVLRQMTSLKFCTSCLSFYGVIPTFQKKYLKLLNPVIVTAMLSLSCRAFWFAQKDIDATKQYKNIDIFSRKIYFSETILIVFSTYFRFIRNGKEIVRCTRDTEYLSILSTYKGNWFSILSRLAFHVEQYIYFRNIINADNPKAVNTFMMYGIIEGMLLFISEMYIQIICLIRHEYGRIKTDLAEWIESYNNKAESVSECRLLQIQRRHGKLCHLANSLDKIYSLEIFFYVTEDITFILMLIIAPTNYANVKESFAALNLRFLIEKLFNIIYPCLITDLLRRTMLETEKVLYSIRVDKCNPELLNTLTLMSLQLNYRKPRFDCGGFVKMDIGFLESIAKVLISFTATLAQLSKNQQRA